MFSTAAFRIAWSTTNGGNTSNVEVFGTQGSAFTEGIHDQTDPSRAVTNTVLAVGIVPTNILTVRCREVYGTRVNLGRIVPKLVSGSTESTKGAVIQLCKNAVISGDRNFSYVNVAGSIAELDTNPGAVTITTDGCIATIPIGAAAAAGLDQFNDLLLPGETLTFAMSVTAVPAANMTGSFIWDEDK